MENSPGELEEFALTSYELRDYRRELERAIKGIFSDAPVQADLRAKLDAVLAEQEDRAPLNLLAKVKPPENGVVSWRPTTGARQALPWPFAPGDQLVNPAWRRRCGRSTTGCGGCPGRHAA